MKTHLEAYRQSRDDLLEQVLTELPKDERLVAAWATGSFGRRDADQVSDLDLSLVAAEAYSQSLCARPEQRSDQTTEVRLALFSTFGKPALIHENNHNAPDGGTFTFVLYEESALMIDWTLIPMKSAKRPFESFLLFDKQNIPVAPLPELEELEQAKTSVAEQWAFFWMMAAVTVKYIIRQDTVFVTTWLEKLHGIMQEIERQVQRKPWKYTRGSLSQLQPTPEKQIESIRELCDRMVEMKAKVAEFIGAEPLTPTSEIDHLLSLAANAPH